MKFIFLLFFLVIFFNGFSQLSFTFESGNLDEWTQSTPNHWEISSEESINGLHSLHHSFDNLTSGHDQISHPSGSLTLSDTTTWIFTVRYEYSPSSSNNWAVFLMSDNSAAEMFPGGRASGYAVGVNFTGSDDYIKLWKIDQGIASELINSKLVWDSIADASGELTLMVKRSPGGNWFLYTESVKEPSSFILAGTSSNAELKKDYYFGIYYRYSASQDRKLWIDDISIDGKFVSDTTPPKIDTVYIVSPQEILIRFNEPINPPTLQNFKKGTANCDSIRILTDDEIMLYFNQKFVSGDKFKISVNGISDKAGNIIDNLETELYYYVPKQFDVLISEIMADPDPAVELPNYEYLELYNRTEFNINLENWILKIGDNQKVFPSVVIPAKEFLIICGKDAERSFGKIGKTVCMLSNSYALNNTGENIILRDSSRQIISFISYSDERYSDIYKKDGGWSLEMIDPLNPCGGIENWLPSVDPSGGTPGRVNSVNAENPDLTKPDLIKLQVPSDSALILTFSEPFDSTVVFEPSMYSVNQNIGHPVKIESFDETYTKLVLFFSKHFTSGKIYDLAIKSTFTDCAGNTLGSDITNRFALPVSSDSLNIVINEVLFNAYPYGSEFIEFYNRSAKVIDAGTLIFSKTDSAGHINAFVAVEEKGTPFLPGTYLLITQNIENVRKFYNVNSTKNFSELKNLFSLDDKAGTILLQNLQGKVIDKFNYNEEMHFALLPNKEGVSLERINFERPTNSSSNWHSAAQTAGYGTPGYRNSQAIDDKLPDQEIHIEPEVFTPNNDGKDDLLTIECHFKTKGNTVNITVFDRNGRIIKHLIRNTLMGSNESITWDGCDDFKNLQPAGIYILFIQIINVDGRTEEFKKVCIVSR